MVDWVTPFARCGGIIKKSTGAPTYAACAVKLLNLLMIVPLVAGCASDLQGRQAARIVELESYTQELEAKVTMLKEASLKATARTACLSSPGDASKHDARTEQANSEAAKASARDKASAEQSRNPSPTSAPADLPVVRLSPARPFASAQDADRSDEAGPALDPVAASSDSPAASSDQARPVLKLHGAQEGKVYMRTLTAAEKDTTL